MANITSTHQNQGAGILSRQGSHKTNPGGRPNLGTIKFAGAQRPSFISLCYTRRKKD